MKHVETYGGSFDDEDLEARTLPFRTAIGLDPRLVSSLDGTARTHAFLPRHFGGS